MRISLKHVHAVKAKGRTYYYHRITRKRIKAEPGTVAFGIEIENENKRVAARKPIDATLGGLIIAYSASVEFRSKKPRTRRDYERALIWLKKGAGIPLMVIDQPTVIAMRDRAYKAHGRRFANGVIAMISILFNWGKVRGLVTANPAQGAPKVERPKDMPAANRPWTPAEREAVLQVASPHLALPIALGLYAALREGDMIELTWANYDGQAIDFIQGKTDDPVWIPVTTELKRMLDETRETRIQKRRDRVVVGLDAKEPPQICLNSRGAKWTKSGFRASFFKLLRTLEAKGAVGSGLTFHGLRHTAATEIAERAGSEREIASMLGHRTSDMARHYTKRADSKRLARSAVVKMEQGGDENL